jgi:hypothetical protein
MISWGQQTNFFSKFFELFVQVRFVMLFPDIELASWKYVVFAVVLLK